MMTLQTNPIFEISATRTPRISPSMISYKPISHKSLHLSHKRTLISSSFKKEDLLPIISDPKSLTSWKGFPVVPLVVQIKSMVEKNQDLQVTIFKDAILAFMLWIFPKLLKWMFVIFKNRGNEFIVKDDVIVFTYYGDEMAGIVIKVGEKKTAIQTADGFRHLDNPEFEKLRPYNVTYKNDAGDVIWGIHKVFEVKCDLGKVDKVILKIESLLDGNELVKENAKYNRVKVKSLVPPLSIFVSFHVKPSMLKDPPFQSYHDMRMELLGKIRIICEDKGGWKWWF